MSTDRLKIKPDDLSVAAIKAVGTESASAPKPVTPPAAAGTSPIDAAAGRAAGAAGYELACVLRVGVGALRYRSSERGDAALSGVGGPAAGHLQVSRD